MRFGAEQEAQALREALLSLSLTRGGSALVVALIGHRWLHFPLAGNGKIGQDFEIDSPGHDDNPASAILNVVTV